MEDSALDEYSQGSWCMHDILDGLDGDDKYLVDDMIIYHHGRLFLTRISSLKEKLLHAAHEDFLAMHLGAYSALLEEFIWEGIQHGLYKHMEICRARMFLERLAQPFPYSLEERESIQMSHFSSRTGVHGEGGTYSHFDLPFFT